jgi:hypothetical protein
MCRVGAHCGCRILHEGDFLTLDGNEGALYSGAVQTELEYPINLLSRLESLCEQRERSTV